MGTKLQVSAATASGDTTKTLIDTLTVPKSAKAIVGIYGHGIGAATLTTGEAVTGIIELESNDLNLAPCQIPLEQVTILTSGAVAQATKVWPVNIAVSGGEEIKGYITMDMAQTGGLKARFGIVYDA